MSLSLINSCCCCLFVVILHCSPSNKRKTPDASTKDMPTITPNLNPSVAQLMAVAGVDEMTATNLLQQTGGDLNAALEFMFF